MTTTDRLPPQEIENERAVLGAAIFDPAAMDRAVEGLTESDFYSTQHGMIFRAILDLYNAGTPVDTLTVVGVLRDKDQIDNVGGAAYIAELVQEVPTAAGITDSIKRVKNAAGLRSIIARCSDAVRSAYEAGAQTPELINRTEQAMLEISGGLDGGALIPLSDYIEPALREIEESIKRSGPLGLSTGYIDLDALTGGFRPGNLIVLAAKTSVGKTAFALCMANYIARTERSVGIFSLEMSADEILQRMIAIQSGCNLSNLHAGKTGRELFRSTLVPTAAKIGGLNIWIDDSATITPLEIRSRARRLHRRHNLDLIVIDYLQLVTPNEHVDSRAREIAIMSRSLKALARELRVPVLVLCQFSRKADDREYPRLSDLKESGSIEQDADVVLFLVRDKDDEARGRKSVRSPGLTVGMVAKQRNGPIGPFYLLFEKMSARFRTATHGTDYTEEDIPT